LARVGKLQIADQIMDADTERVRDKFQGVNGHVAFAALDFPHVSAVQSGTIGEDILGPALLRSQRSYGRSNFSLNLLHSSQFGRTLVKSIQVISCISSEVYPRRMQSEKAIDLYLKELEDV
jgi:hypothetical protein